MLEEKNMNLSDREFNVIRTFVQSRTEEEIIMFICERFNEWSNEVPKDLLEYVINFHKRFKFWGEFDPANQKIELILQRASILKNKWNEIEYFYESLSDHRSKDVLVMILENWLTFSFQRIKKVKENNFKPYFDLDLLKMDENEVFVDLGAWKGDTIDDYIKSYGTDKYAKIYTYEIVKENIDILEQKFSYDKKIIIRPVGVSSEEGIMYLSENGTTDAQALVTEGSKEIKTVTLDNDITEKITFLKMDIEGAERDAILGAQRHIKEDIPKLAISIYHSNEDLLQIFNIIKNIQPNYKFYLRYNGLPYFPTDYILIGVPC